MFTVTLNAVGQQQMAPKLDNDPKKDAGDDDYEDGTTCSEQEYTDPAIIAVGGGMSVVTPAVSEYRYSKEDLIRIRSYPSSQRRPKFLNSAFYDANGIWDPARWHYNVKTLAAGNLTDGNDGQIENGDPTKRKPGDPRERLRKEQDGIVLSPQRRSFNSGCFVPVRDPVRPNNRPHSPLGKPEAPHLSHRDIYTAPSSRRIGSGRILPWDYQEKADAPDNENYGPRRERRDTDERYDRRSFGRDFDLKDNNKRGGGGVNNGRYNNRRISSESREEEPEWFSSGPISQNDTIELRGFDESEKINGKKKNVTQKKKKNDLHNNGNSIDKIDEVVVTKNAEKVTPSPTPQDGGGVHQQSAKEKESAVGAARVSPPKEQNDSSFNFEDILKCENLTEFPGLLSNGVESGDAAGSRFSRWFNRSDNSPSNKVSAENRCPSLPEASNDHHQIIKNLLGEQFNEPSVAIPQPGDSESYFAPISPAASSVPVQQQQQQQQQKSLNLMEMLQRGNKIQEGNNMTQPIQQPMKEIPGKILSLEELEAGMRQQGSNVKHQPKAEEDVKAFKRLVNSLNQKPPMSIMEMLSQSQQQDEARMASHRMNNYQMTDIQYKLQHVHNQVQQQQQQQQQQKQAQMEMLTKLMNAGFATTNARASPLPEMGINQSKELLNRPEAQAILQGLKRGDITPQHLNQQLANPAMQPRHRELVYTILKMYQVTGAMQQPQPVSPVNPPHHSIYQQQLRVSPLPPNAYCVSPVLATSPNTLTVPAMHQRIPSPRELQLHTQNIMQRALIKKKLEEQEENYRKKQQQRGNSPAKTASPTRLAFTPTSVLRKMTADKDDSSKEAKGDSKIPQGRPLIGMRPQQSNIQAQQQQVNWNNQFAQQMKQPGRPIVKANNNYQANQQEQFFLQQQQQQQRLQQQLQQQRKNQQTFGQSFVNQNQPYQQQHQQLSQQQLRAQHQNVRTPQHQTPFGQQQTTPWPQQMMQGQQGYDNRAVGRPSGIEGGDLSPTSNQLARWFSPDLLESARKGKLPRIPASALPQHTLSLEEVERQTTPVGHN
ncbi:PREDICTED: eukaryotic translation initiation factor 4E transporter-like isoform X2 [Nicrophorus vespilloides]|uniref:Eukaryotic translation initiation factor 4E transporter-like isoform X2 n=1 Tax=Nicrophorus vespilloides TaxID=110193 RepID=A0ABM1MY32_NICVS|nr:PREDICTED: eukaryotic translation initiation factor 4E transporter-like isoform X2 [Nicrophorus vespilloides]